jgi:uncharacterized protein (TIGR02145 family)
MKLNFHFPHKTCLLAVFGLLLFSQAIHAQVRDIYGNKVSSELCDQMEFDTDKEVQRLVTKLLEVYNLPNRYIIGPCSRVSNCVATRDERGRPYILYNPAFLDKIKVFAFTETDLPTAAEDWAVLLVLAHEIGHHLNNHIINPHPDLTKRDMELEADETAGYLLYLLNAPDLKTAQKGLQVPQVSEAGSYTHPPRSERLAAFRKGWDKAEERFPHGPVKKLDKIKSDCGAYVAPNEWKSFMCYNLGTTNTSADPLTPSWEITGGYWQWGNNIQAVPGPSGPGTAQENDGEIIGWSTNYNKNSSWSDFEEIGDDPCPLGFRVPTKKEWEGVIKSNIITRIGSWENDNTNYNSGIKLGSQLMLPTAGFRFYEDGTLFGRGYCGCYWSETTDNKNEAAHLYFNSNYIRTISNIKGNGFSVRCISK